MPQGVGGWWHHRQTAKAPARPCVFEGFPIYVDGGVDGFIITWNYFNSKVYLNRFIP